MSKSIYIGINQVARTVMGAQVGIEHMARRVTAGYMGVGDVARPFYSLSRGPTRYGTVPLPDCIAAAGIGAHAIFLGVTEVVAYDSTLTAHALEFLASSRIYPAAAQFGTNVMFLGGYRVISGTEVLTRVVDVYNETFVRSAATGLTQATRLPSAAQAGDCLLISLGMSPQAAATTTINVYNSTFARSTGAPLSTARKTVMAASVNGEAVFAGGQGLDDLELDVFDVYAADLTRTNPTTLASPRAYGASLWTGRHLLFAGGTAQGEVLSSVDGTDETFARISVPPLSVARSHLGGSCAGSYALFAGGNQLAAVDGYDASLAHTALDPLLAAPDQCFGASAGAFALFSGTDGQATVYEGT